MDLIIQGLIRAFELIIKGDKEVFSIALLTIKVSGTATIISLVLGVPLGYILPCRDLEVGNFGGGG